MKVDGEHYRTIWADPEDRRTIRIIDQSKLPHSFEVMELRAVEDFVTAIKDMRVRGAGLIGATAGYGMHAAAQTAPPEHLNAYIAKAGSDLIATRPTAKNLEWAVERQRQVLDEAEKQGASFAEKQEIVFKTATDIANEDAEFCRKIGEHGASLIERIAEQKNGGPVHILTHCNAGWLAFVDYGSATAPIYAAFERGIDIHVWVDETRPRNQGASLTAWELGKHGVPHHLIVDNAGGHLMQHGMVDLAIVGADRVTVTGDAANKIGTYLKALAAKDNTIPFYVALPSSTFDWEKEDGVHEIPIEERDQDEVRYITGEDESGSSSTVLLCPQTTQAKNFGFDVTPHRLITGLITERGICSASKEEILSLYPEKRKT